MMRHARGQRQQPRGKTMHVVPCSEREHCRAKLEVQIENLRVLVGRTEASSGDLEHIGGHLSAALLSLNQRERIEVQVVQLPTASDAEWPSLDAATLAGAGALQEATASVDLMRLRSGVVPSQAELLDLGHRLALADAAFRIVAVSARRSGLLPKASADRA